MYNASPNKGAAWLHHVGTERASNRITLALFACVLGRMLLSWGVTKVA